MRYAEYCLDNLDLIQDRNSNVSLVCVVSLILLTMLEEIF